MEDLMSARGITWGAFLLIAVGFVAGRAFSQNEIPGGSSSKEPEGVASPVLDAPATESSSNPFEIPMPPTSSQPTTESVSAPVSGQRGVPGRSSARPLTTMPAKYFIPAGKAKEKEEDQAAVNTLRERFTKVAAEKAAIMSADELQSEITAIEKILTEFSAKQALERAEKALESVVSEYPDTAAGRDAKRALEAIKARPSNALRPVQREF
jgi:hypothetical protein